MIELKKIEDFNPPPEWMEIHTIEAHTGGEPLRVILSGYPSIDASAILKLRKELLLKHDYLRRVLMWEPRGHSDMYGVC